MDESKIRLLLKPFRLELTSTQLAQVQVYLALLLRWNRAVNLTSIREPDEIIPRHFGESMFLTAHCRLRGTLLDVGSGAGFPGLALKIAEPELGAILLEPVAKKRAFLKEVARECRIVGVEVRGERVEEFCRGTGVGVDSMTARAVGAFQNLLSSASRCLRRDGGELYLWLTRSEGKELLREQATGMRGFKWEQPISIPLSREREIWIGSIVSRETL